MILCHIDSMSQYSQLFLADFPSANKNTKFLFVSMMASAFISLLSCYNVYFLTRLRQKLEHLKPSVLVLRTSATTRLLTSLKMVKHILITTTLLDGEKLYDPFQKTRFRVQNQIFWSFTYCKLNNFLNTKYFFKMNEY